MASSSSSTPSSTSSTQERVLTQRFPDPYFGRIEICKLCENTVTSLFPLPSTSCEVDRSKVPQLGEWIGYIFYRTALPRPTIFLALHLLQRISQAYSFSENPDSASHSPLIHHRLIFTAIVLATKYNMDDCYSNKSWSIASKEIFSVQEVNEMEIEMLRSLDFQIGYPQLPEVVAQLQHSWESSFYPSSASVSPKSTTTTTACSPVSYIKRKVSVKKSPCPKRAVKKSRFDESFSSSSPSPLSSPEPTTPIIGSGPASSWWNSISSVTEYINSNSGKSQNSMGSRRKSSSIGSSGNQGCVWDSMVNSTSGGNDKRRNSFSMGKVSRSVSPGRNGNGNGVITTRDWRN